MGFIFTGSTDLLSARHTSRFIVPVLRWFNPKLSEKEIRRIQFTIRKCGHVSEYAVLSVLIWWTKRGTKNGEQKKSFWRDARFAILISALYAATDEFHQSFVVDTLGNYCAARFANRIRRTHGNHHDRRQTSCDPENKNSRNRRSDFMAHRRANRSQRLSQKRKMASGLRKNFRHDTRRFIGQFFRRPNRRSHRRHRAAEISGRGRTVRLQNLS